MPRPRNACRAHVCRTWVDFCRVRVRVRVIRGLGRIGLGCNERTFVWRQDSAKPHLVVVLGAGVKHILNPRDLHRIARVLRRPVHVVPLSKCPRAERHSRSKCWSPSAPVVGGDAHGASKQSPSEGPTGIIGDAIAIDCCGLGCGSRPWSRYIAGAVSLRRRACAVGIASGERRD